MNVTMSFTDNSTMQLFSNGTDEAMDPPKGCLPINFSVNPPWNHPEDLVSHKTQQEFNKFVNVYMLTFLVIVSVPTNILNMLVFWRHGIRERINLCLFCLSFADFIIVLSHFEWNLDGLYAELSGTQYTLVVMKFNVNNKIHSLAGFIYVSGFMSMLIAFERCLCVVSPFKAKSIIQTRTTAIIIAIGHVVILSGHYIIATRWEVVCMFDSIIKQTTLAFFSSEFYLKHKGLVDLFDGILFGILLPCLYVIGILITTAITIHRLRKMSKWREQTFAASASAGDSASKDLTLTRMLIGTSILFIVCTTPPLIFHAALPFEQELSLSGKYFNTYYLLINMQQLLIYINSSVNFFIYYFQGSKYRRTVQSIFCKHRMEESQQSKKTTSTDPTTDPTFHSQSFSKTTEID